MEKVVIVGGKEVKMRASALIPRLYRFKFGRDMIRDLTELKKKFEKIKAQAGNVSEEEQSQEQLSVLDLTIFENTAWLMAKHADKSIPDDPDEWLQEFEMFSIYEVLPQIMELWNLTNMTTAIPKKK